MPENLNEIKYLQTLLLITEPYQYLCYGPQMQKLQRIDRSDWDLPALQGEAVNFARRRPDLVEEAQRIFEAGENANTLRAYAGDWKRWAAFCAENGLLPRPADPRVVMLYLTQLHMEGKKESTILRAATSISQGHKQAPARERKKWPEDRREPCADSAVRDFVKKLRRGVSRKAQGKAPFLPADISEAFPYFDNSVRGVRSKFILTFGFAGAFRREEFAQLQTKHVEDIPGGFRVHIERSKTDQTSKGRYAGIDQAENRALCPVLWYRRWLEVAEIENGPVLRPVHKGGKPVDRFVDGRVIAETVKEAAEALGYDPADYGGHSLRAGFVTAAVRAGKSEFEIRKQTGHQTLNMVLKYIRDENVLGPSKGLL